MRQQLLLVALVLTSVVAGAAPAAGQESVTLTVSVVNESGDPVGGATIEATWEGGETTARTASNGKAFVDVPKGADVALDVESDEYIRNTPRVVEDASEQAVTVEVAPKGEFSVRITDTEGPVQNVRVSLKKGGTTIAEGRTDSDGRFAAPVIEQGEYTLDTFKSGYIRNVTDVTVNESTATKLEMRQATVNVQFRVVDDHFEPPETLTDAQVTVDGVGTQRTTGGTVTFTVPVNTQYGVSATKEAYETNETRYFVGTTEKTKTLVIQREANLTLSPSNKRIVVGEQVTVTVTNAYDETVADAAVTLDGEQVATTDADGTARVAIDSEGAHTLTAALEGVESAEVSVEGIGVDDATPTDSPTATETPEAGPQAPLPGFTPVTVVLALLTLAGVGFLVRRR